VSTSGVAIAARGLRRTLRDGRRILQDVSIDVGPGELLAIVGVAFDGVDLYRNLDRFRSILGYVPQEDIIARERGRRRVAETPAFSPVRRMIALRRCIPYAAELHAPCVANHSIEGCPRVTLEEAGTTT
jgi:hypothetical protein